MYLNHSTAGALAIKPIIDKYSEDLTEKEKSVLWISGITAAILPDFDIAYSVLAGVDDHRSFVTHGLFLYLMASVIIYLLSYFQKKDAFGKKFFRLLSVVFLVGILSHLFIDLIFGGIAYFAPFSYQIFGFNMNIQDRPGNRFTDYVFSKYMVIEVMVFILFLKFLRDKKYIFPKLLSLFYFFMAIIAFIVVSFIFD
jgi:hypothetical protein